MKRVKKPSNHVVTDFIRFPIKRNSKEANISSMDITSKNHKKIHLAEINKIYLKLNRYTNIAFFMFDLFIIMIIIVLALGTL